MMNWKKYITFKNAVIFIAVLYLISVIERALQYNHQDNSVMIQYMQDRIDMITRVNTIDKRIDSYEKSIIIKNAVIDGYSNAQLDSAWADMFRAQ